MLLNAWLIASGRKEEPSSEQIDPSNVRAGSGNLDRTIGGVSA
jgi:hypothetical protein